MKVKNLNFVTRFPYYLTDTSWRFTVTKAKKLTVHVRVFFTLLLNSFRRNFDSDPFCSSVLFRWSLTWEPGGNRKRPIFLKADSFQQREHEIKRRGQQAGYCLYYYWVYQISGQDTTNAFVTYIFRIKTLIELALDELRGNINHISNNLYVMK